MTHELTDEWKHVQEHEILERKRARVYLVGFAAIVAVVAIGLLFALRWIGLTIQ